jgi:ribose 5-phosphate isomerase RpiB
MITLRETLAAHLCGVGMGMAMIVGMVPGMVQMMRMLAP